MIIDVHTHIGCYGAFYPEAWWEKQRSTKFRNIMTKGRNWSRPITDFTPKDNPEVWDISDIDGSSSVKKMKEVGIDKCVMLPMDFGLMGINLKNYHASMSLVTDDIDAQNKHICDVAKEHHELIPFCSIDPRRGKAGLISVERAVKEWGAKGLKLHPTAGWFVNDRELCYPLYELVMDLDIPILAHCGPEGGFCPSKYGNAQLWEDVLSDFPEMRLCLAHAAGAMGEFVGGSLLGPATSMLFFYDNVYMDMSCSALLYKENPVKYYKDLRILLSRIGGKVLFGTDSPWMTNRGPGWAEQLQTYLEPKQEFLDEAGVTFTREEMGDILGNNAMHWLNLK